MITEDRRAELAAEARPDAPEHPKKQKRSAKQSGLYRVVWRWHFYAGLFSIPIIARGRGRVTLHLSAGPLSPRPPWEQGGCAPRRACGRSS